MKNHITSLGVSQKLKEAGFKKQGCFEWYFGFGDKKNKNKWRLFQNDIDGDKSKSVYAYQVNEILAELPKVIKIKDGYCNLEIMPFENHSSITYRLAGSYTCHGTQESETLQDALALMWLFLKKENYV